MAIAQDEVTLGRLPCDDADSGVHLLETCDRIVGQFRVTEIQLRQQRKRGQSCQSSVVDLRVGKIERFELRHFRDRLKARVRYRQTSQLQAVKIRQDSNVRQPRCGDFGAADLEPAQVAERRQAGQTLIG